MRGEGNCFVFKLLAEDNAFSFLSQIVGEVLKQLTEEKCK